MFKRSLSFFAATALLCVAALGRDLPYQGGAAGSVVESVYIAVPEVNGGPFLVEHAEANGHFTYVGNTDISLDWEVSLQSNGEWLHLVVEGTFEMTAANGDTMSGSFVSWQEYGNPNYVIYVKVLQGTGRYAGAAGTIPGTGQRIGADFSYNLSGTISLRN